MIKKVLTSISVSSILLQYGLLMGFLLAAIVGFSWLREMTIALFLFSAVGVAFSVVKVGLPKPRLLDILFISFLVLVLISMAQQGWSEPGVSANFFFVPLMMIAPYICGRLTGGRDIIQLIRWLLVLAVVALLMAIVLLLGDTNSRFHYRPILHGGDEITARLALLLAYAGIILSYLLTRRMVGGIRFTKASAKLLSALILVTLLIIFLGLRAVVLVFLLILLLNAYSAKWLPALTRVAYGLMISALVVVASLSMQQVRETNNMLVTGVLNAVSLNAVSENCSATKQNVNSASIRLELYHDAWRAFAANPFIGVGAGAYGKYSCWQDARAHPHNVLLQVMAELGIFGFFIFAIMLVYCVWIVLCIRWRLNNYKNLIPLFFAFALINSFVNGNYFTSMDLWWGFGAMSSYTNVGSRWFHSN
jgi:O-antigen ligase